MISVETVTSDNPKPLANYSEAMRAGSLVFAAGQIASDYKTGIPAEARKHPAFPFYGSDIKLQSHYILKNLSRTFAESAQKDHCSRAQRHGQQGQPGACAMGGEGAYAEA